MTSRVVVEVVAVEQLPVGASGSRRALVRWSDGTVGEALRWWDDFCGYPASVVLCGGSRYADNLAYSADAFGTSGLEPLTIPGSSLLQEPGLRLSRRPD